MRRGECRFVFALVWAIAAAWGRPALAGEPAWLKDAMAKPLPPAPADAPAVVLVDRIELRVAADLMAEVREVKAIKILRSTGLDNATFEAYLPPGGKLADFRVWSLEGRERRSQAGRGDALESTFYPGEYTDTRRISLRAPVVNIGDVVAMESIVRARLWFPSYSWWPQTDGLATARSEIAVELPRDWRVEIHATRIRPQESAGAGATRELAAGPIAAIPNEGHSPPWRDVAPLVRLCFLDPAGSRTFANWTSVATWYQRIASPSCEPRQAPEDLVRRARSADSSRAMAVLAREVQRSVSYAAIELGMQAWIPDAAADTWQRRYGDCKDKATVCVAALGAVGITARLVLVCTRDLQTVDPESPDPGQFNHCIVAIAWPGTNAPATATANGPSGRAWTFFDPTDPVTPLGMLPRADAGAWAVIADSTEGLVRLPSPGQSVLRGLTRAKLENDGALAGVVTLSGEGAAAAALARDFESASDEIRRQRASEWIDTAAGRPEVLGVRWTSLDSVRFTSAIEIAFRLGGGARRAGNAWMIRPLYVAHATIDSPADTARALPFVLGGPAQYEDRFELELPAGYHATSVTETAWSGAIGEYSLSRESSDAQIVLTRRLVLRADVVPASGFAEVQQLLRRAQGGDTAALLLRP